MDTKQYKSQLTQNERELLDRFNALNNVDKGRIIERIEYLLSTYPSQKRKQIIMF